MQQGQPELAPAEAQIGQAPVAGLQRRAEHRGGEDGLGRQGGHEQKGLDQHHLGVHRPHHLGEVRRSRHHSRMQVAEQRDEIRAEHARQGPARQRHADDQVGQAPGHDRNGPLAHQAKARPYRVTDRKVGHGVPPRSWPAILTISCPIPQQTFRDTVARPMSGP